MIKNGARKKDSTARRQLVTYDSMPWTKNNRSRRYIDKTERAKEDKKKIDNGIKKVEQDLDKIERSAEKAKDKTTSKFIQSLKKNLKKAAVFTGRLLAVATAYAAIYSVIYGSLSLVTIGVDRLVSAITLRSRERAAQERFNQWRAENGRPPAGNNPPAARNNTPAAPSGSRNNSYFAEQLRNLRQVSRDLDQVLSVVREARNANRAVGNTSNGIRELDLGDNPTTYPSNNPDDYKTWGPSTSPGEHGARFSGLDLDSNFRDSMKVLNLRKKQLRDAAIAYKRAMIRVRRYRNIPQLITNLKQKS